MKRSIFFLIVAIFSTLIGGMSLFLPDKMVEGFGMESTPVIIFLARELGVYSLFTGVLNFLVRNDPDSRTLRAVLIYDMAYHLVMIPVNLSGVTQNVFGFSQALPPLVIHIFIAIGSFLYLSKMKTGVK